MMKKSPIKLTLSQKMVLEFLNDSLSQTSEFHKIFYNKKWIRNSYASWQKQMDSFSIITIRRAFLKLEKLKFIQSRTFHDGKIFAGGEQVKYYAINFNQLIEKNMIHLLGKSNLNE